MSDNDTLAAILAAVTRMEGGYAAMQTEMAGLRTEVADARVEAAGTRTELTRLRVDMMARMDRLSDQISAIRDDIGVNMERADRVQQANDGTRAELRALAQEVTGMSRQIRNLQTRVAELDNDQERRGPQP